jgi:hypothetical protein
MNFLRSLLHALWMLVTVVPWGLLMLLVSTRVRAVLAREVAIVLPGEPAGVRAPPRGEAAARFMDVADFRLFVEATAKVHLATLGPSRELFANVTATYDYFAHPVASLPWDASVMGGLGVGF